MNIQYIYIQVNCIFNNCYQFNDDNPAAYLFIGETYNDNMDFVRKSKIDCIERYRMLQVRAVCDK